MSGEGKAVVCAVGRNTQLARLRGNTPLKIEEKTTHLEEKLTQISV
jgi:magnesium-transporting ATPase (P-type)